MASPSATTRTRVQYAENALRKQVPVDAESIAACVVGPRETSSFCARHAERSECGKVRKVLLVRAVVRSVLLNERQVGRGIVEQSGPALSALTSIDMKLNVATPIL